MIDLHPELHAAKRLYQNSKKGLRHLAACKGNGSIWIRSTEVGRLPMIPEDGLEPIRNLGLLNYIDPI